MMSAWHDGALPNSRVYTSKRAKPKIAMMMTMLCSMTMTDDEDSRHESGR